MLNIPLYNALYETFGQAWISGENTRAEFSLTAPKHTKVKRVGKNVRKYATVTKWGECYRVNCPKCGDTKGRLYFCHLYGEKHWDGKTKAPWHFGRIAYCQNEGCDVKEWTDKMVIDRNASEPLYDLKPQVFTGYLQNLIDLPEGCLPIISNLVPPHVKNYLEQRMFSPAHLDSYYSVLWAPPGTIYHKANPDVEGDTDKAFRTDRILIPIINRRQIVSWQARAVTDVKPKYIFPPGFKKTETLYNMDHAWKYPDMVICEGVTDVWRVGPSAVAIFGKVLSTEQLKIMSNLWKFNGSCVILLDPDAAESAKQIEELLIEQRVFPRGVARLTLAPGFDPADYAEHQLEQMIQEARQECII